MFSFLLYKRNILKTRALVPTLGCGVLDRGKKVQVEKGA